MIPSAPVSSTRPSLLSRLWNGELPVFSPGAYRVPAACLTLFLGSSLAIALLLAPHNDSLFLGPGLGLESDPEMLPRFYAYISAQHAWLGYGLIALALVSASCIVGLSAAGYFGHKNALGEHYPLREHLTFPAIALMERVLFAAAVVGLGVVGWALGWDFGVGIRLVNECAVQTDRWVNATVPTLIELPYALAFFVSYGLAGFVHYGLHRASHESRLLWLMFHRFHHMPTVMFSASVPPVFFSVPLFAVLIIPYHLAFAMLTKLVCVQPLYFALIVYKLVYYVPDIWAHSTALFESGRKSRWVRWSGFFLSNGIYHYRHHSSIEGDEMANLGGSFCYLPDLLFGTFRPVPDKLPPIGLTNQPELYYNPIRLALSGMAQIVYELRHNPGIASWLRIVFGSVYYVPPNSRNYAIKGYGPAL